MTLPAAIPIPDADRLLAGLVEVGVLTAEQSAEARSQFIEHTPDGDATLLADHLVQHGLITCYQAERAVVEGADALLLGRYLLVEPVGGSSVGTTYRAVTPATGERFAVRVLPLRSTWRVLQARRRLEAFAALPPHPAVVPFADVDSAAGRHYLAWPWADGEGFDRLVLRNGPFHPAEATRLFAELADGLHALHSAGLPHGLLRPRSLLLGYDRQPRLLDLGVGGILADNVADERSMVDTLALACGSAAMADYIAPEALLDPTTGSPAADAYSFGCCLYFALTGLPPFPEERLAEKVVSHQSRSPVPVRTRNPLVPQPLADLLDRLMRKAADERPSDFAEVRAELRAVADLSDFTTDAAVSHSFASVKAQALAALGDSSRITLSFTRRVDLPPASDVVDFDDVPCQPPVARAAADDPPLTPLPPPPRRGTPAPALAAPPVEPRMPAANADQRTRSAVSIPPPPPFDNAAARAARAVLFWMKPVDAIQLSVFGPAELAPGQRARLLVYAHLPDSFAGVATLCRALHPDAELLGGGYVQVPIPRDSTIQLHLSLPEGSVPRPLVEFTWSGQTQPRSFEVVLPRECSSGWTAATLAAGWQKQKVGEVPFQLMVNGLLADSPGG